MGHARLAPSAAKRWMTCAAAPDREAEYADTDSDAALWGSGAHAILERSLLQETHPLDVDLEGLAIDLADSSPLTLIQHYGDADLLQMRHVAAMAYDYVLFQGDILSEATVNPGALAGRDDCYGTADIQVHVPQELFLEVVDLKGGERVIVEPTDPQLWLYGVGALHQNPIRYPANRHEDITVKLTIVQPRARHPEGPIRSITVTARQLLDWFQEACIPAMEATGKPDAPATPSEEGCRFCKAKRHCPEYTAQRMAPTQAVFRPVQGGPSDRMQLAEMLVQAPGNLQAEQVQYVLDNEALITGWLKAVREHAYNVVLQGDSIPGYKLVHGRSSRHWDGDDKTLYDRFRKLTMQGGKKLTKAALYTETFISPAQAEKNLKPVVAASTWKHIAQRIVKTEGKPTLAPETDSRPAITRAADAFSPVEPDFLQ